MPDRLHRFLKASLPFLAFLAAVSLPPASAAQSEKRLALVIGNSSYKLKALATPVNDAALIAQTLQAAGFDVMAARDLDDGLLRQAFRDFVDCVAKAGPDTVIVVYFAGYGLQLEGENYLVPIGADMTDPPDVPIPALRLSEQTEALAALQVKTAFVIVDAARAGPFVLSGQPSADGFAWAEPETNMLIAFNAAPGTASPDGGAGYGPYAKALAEMIREGGLSPADLFDRVRLRVNEVTNGTQVPWDSSKIETPFNFLERGPGAPPRANTPDLTARMRSRPMQSLTANDAYMVALMRDTLDAYTDFLADHWHDPLTKRAGALLAARREAITWRRTYRANVPESYWSYLERYPRGPHVADARRLLMHLGATIEAPSKFSKMEYDVPPPSPDELEYVERTPLVADHPGSASEPPRPSPVYFLEPPPPEFQALPPPAAPSEAYVLPTPIFVPLPAYVKVPAVVAAQPQAVGPRLPPSVAAKAGLINSQSPAPAPLNSLASEEIQAPQSPPLPTVSLTPVRPTDNEATVNADIEPSAVAALGEPSIPGSTMSAPPSIGMPLLNQFITMLPPRSVGRIPLPRPRPVIRSLPSTSNRSKLTTHAASTSSPEVDQEAQATTPLVNRLARWIHLAPAPGAPPPNSQKKPCPIVNGKQTCNAGR